MGEFGAVAIAVAAVACISDIKVRRVPNLLTFGAAGAALVVQTYAHGSSGLANALAGWMVGCVLFLPFFLLRGMGAGDVKLLAALGAWIGPREAVWLAIYTSLAGGVVALGVSMVRGYLFTALRNIRTLVSYWLTVGPVPMPTMTLDDSQAPRLAYAVPILIGTGLTLWL